MKNVNISFLISLFTLNSCANYSHRTSEDSGAIELQRGISSSEEINELPDDVTALKRNKIAITVDGKKVVAFIMEPLEFHKLPVGFVFYNKFEKKMQIKTKEMAKKPPFGIFEYVIFDNQIPSYRMWSEVGYLPVGQHPDELTKSDWLPEKMNLEIPNRKIAELNPGKVYTISMNDLNNTPLGTLIYHEDGKKSIYLGTKVIDPYSDFDDKESAWGFKISQIPDERFDEDGYFKSSYKIAPDELFTMAPSKLKFQQKYSQINELGERIYFVDKEDFKNLKKGTVLYHPNGARVIVGYDKIPKDSTIKNAQWRKIGFYEKDIASSQIDFDGSSSFDPKIKIQTSKEINSISKAKPLSPSKNSCAELFRFFIK